MRKSLLLAMTVVFLAAGVLRLAYSQDPQRDAVRPVHIPFGPPHVGTAMTAPNIGGEGTLDVLEGGGSPLVWSYDVESGVWKALTNASTGVEHGAAISNLFNGCDFAF